MDYTQNAKIAQVTEKTLIIGVDIGSESHYAEAGQEEDRKQAREYFLHGSEQLIRVLLPLRPEHSS